MVSLRIVLAALGVIFGIIWATIGAGWATVVVLCGLADFYLGAAIESGVDLSPLLEPLRHTR
jgi:hypothetical protein